MAQHILRPLDYGGLFDELFDLYKSHFVLFMGIGGMVYLPINFLSVLLVAPMQGMSRRVRCRTSRGWYGLAPWTCLDRVAGFLQTPPRDDALAFAAEDSHLPERAHARHTEKRIEAKMLDPVSFGASKLIAPGRVVPTRPVLEYTFTIKGVDRGGKCRLVIVPSSAEGADPI